MRSLLRALPWVAGVLAGLQLLFVGLLVAGAVVPDRPIVEQLARDVRTGAYGPGGAPDGMGGRSTSYTDCVAAGTGLGEPAASAFERAAEMPRLQSCSGGRDQIVGLARGETIERGSGYFRYWAGYTTLTRPVLAVAGMDGIRLVAGGLFGVTLVALVLSVARATSTWYAAALTAPLLLSSNLLSVPSTGFSHALSSAAAFGGIALVAWATRHSTRVLLCAVATAAAVFNYVDLLTTPAIPWAWTAAVVAAATYRRTGSLRETLLLGGAAGVLWPLAFAVTWVSRWLFAALFLGWDEVMGQVLEIAGFRVGGEYDEVNQRFAAAIPANLSTWWALPIVSEVVLAASGVAAAVALVLAWRRWGAPGLAAAGVMALPALVVPVWLAVMSNHSQIHHFFVYRTVPAALGIVVAACVLAAAVRPPRPAPSATRRGSVRTSAP